MDGRQVGGRQVGGGQLVRGQVPASQVRAAGFAELDATTLYRILRLRVDVFVVEQACPYPELDGRDLEPATIHLWVQEADGVLAYLRVLAEVDGSRRIGRVVTAPLARGRGLAAVLVREAVTRCAGSTVVLDAQAHLEGWYERRGFARDGEEFVEDGIPHVPMRLAATGGARRPSP